MKMSSFQHITPPLRLFHGPDSLGMIARELARLNSRRALIVCGATLGRAGSVLEAVLWHGGEAQPMRDTVVSLQAADRDALVAFLESL